MGNDFATGNAIPRSIPQAVDILKNGRIEKRDVIKIGDRHSVNLAGFGFDITVSEIHLKTKVLRGGLLYFYAIIAAIFKHKSFYIKIETDTGITLEGRTLMLNLGNNKFSAGGYPTCPRADMTDGLLDVMFMEDCPAGTRLKLLQLVKKGCHLEHPLVHYNQAKSVIIECEVPIAYHTEGEVFYTEQKRISARIIPKYLNLIVP